MMRDIRVCGKLLDHGTNVFLAAAYWDFCNFFFFLEKRYVRVHCRPAGVIVCLLMKLSYELYSDVVTVCIRREFHVCVCVCRGI